MAEKFSAVKTTLSSRRNAFIEEIKSVNEIQWDNVRKERQVAEQDKGEEEKFWHLR